MWPVPHTYVKRVLYFLGTDLHAYTDKIHEDGLYIHPYRFTYLFNQSGLFCPISIPPQLNTSKYFEILKLNYSFAVVLFKERQIHSAQSTYSHAPWGHSPVPPFIVVVLVQLLPFHDSLIHQWNEDSVGPTRWLPR